MAKEILSDDSLLHYLNLGLKAKEIIILYLIEKADTTLTSMYRINSEHILVSDLDRLKEEGFIELIDKRLSKNKVSSYKISDSLYKQLGIVNKKKAHPGSVSTWIKDWFNLFPSGVKSGGKYLKTDIKSCENKMKKFIKEYPHFTVEEIFEATKGYLADREQHNYAYCSLAPYFIFKDSMSSLAGWCEQINEATPTEQNDDPFTTKA